MKETQQVQLRAKLSKPTAIVHFGGDYAWLSNFSGHRVVVDGAEYKTAEHAFQALKTTDAAQHAHIAAASTPAEAKRRGRDVSRGPNLTPSWFGGGRDEAMRKVLAAKVRARALAAARSALARG